MMRLSVNICNILSAFGLRVRVGQSVRLASGLSAFLRVSRGLIHHAVLGELLAQAIVHDDESLLPSVTRRFQV